MNPQDIDRTVETYADMLIRLAWQNTRSRADAEDIVQETFLRLLKQRPFDSEEHRKAWLIRVTVNLCKDFHKSAHRRKTVPLDEARDQAPEPEPELPEEFWALSERERSVLHLHYFEGYTIAEIASVLGKSPNTVGSWLTRAKARLKTMVWEGSV